MWTHGTLLQDLLSLPAERELLRPGHRIHVCKKCSRLPREVRFRSEALDEIWGFLDQSIISEKNVRRLSLLAESADPEVREMASIVHAIGKAHPGRRRRYKKIRADHPELWQRIVKKGIVEEWEVEEWTGPAERDYAFDASEEMTDENAPSRDGCN